jgi:capsular polysaccharide biosynthesis protein
LPIRSNLSFGFIAFLAATVSSTSLAFAAEYFDSAFHSSAEVMAYLHAPVLAALPKDVA